MTVHLYSAWGPEAACCGTGYDVIRSRGDRLEDRVHALGEITCPGTGNIPLNRHRGLTFDGKRQ